MKKGYKGESRTDDTKISHIPLDRLRELIVVPGSMLSYFVYVGGSSAEDGRPITGRKVLATPICPAGAIRSFIERVVAPEYVGNFHNPSTSRNFSISKFRWRKRNAEYVARMGRGEIIITFEPQNHLSIDAMVYIDKRVI